MRNSFLRPSALTALAFLLLLVVAGGPSAVRAAAGPPAQKLPSALLVFPLIDSGGGRETRIELVNLRREPVNVECFYVNGESPECTEVGFYLTLTPHQPMSWIASAGVSNEITATAAPPFFGYGELRCAAVPIEPRAEMYNAIQGRATVWGPGSETVSYSAVGFQRFQGGEFDGVMALNGSQYAQCPDRLHFSILADTDVSSSSLVVIPCTRNHLLQTVSTAGVQVLVTNEFEQTFSASFQVSCWSLRSLASLSSALQRSVLGSDTGHLSLRGIRDGILGLVIDSVPAASFTGMAGNEPSFRGGRSATVTFPQP